MPSVWLSTDCKFLRHRMKIQSVYEYARHHREFGKISTFVLSYQSFTRNIELNWMRRRDSAWLLRLYWVLTPELCVDPSFCWNEIGIDRLRWFVRVYGVEERNVQTLPKNHKAAEGWIRPNDGGICDAGRSGCFGCVPSVSEHPERRYASVFKHFECFIIRAARLSGLCWSP